MIHNTSWETLWGMKKQQKPSCWQVNRVPNLTQNAQQQEGWFQLGIATLVQGENNQISSLWYTSLHKLWMCLKLDKVLLSVICAHAYTYTHTPFQTGTENKADQPVFWSQITWYLLQILLEWQNYYLQIQFYSTMLFFSEKEILF